MPCTEYAETKSICYNWEKEAYISLKNISEQNKLWFVHTQFSRSVVSDSLRPHESQHARPPCPSPTTRVYSNSCPSSRWCHPAISSSVVPFSFPQTLPASGSFPVSQLLAWGHTESTLIQHEFIEDLPFNRASAGRTQKASEIPFFFFFLQQYSTLGTF